MGCLGRGGERVLFALLQSHGDRRPGQFARRLASHTPVNGTGRHHAALRRDPLRAGLREPGLSLSHVSARHLADIESVLRRLQLAPHHSLTAKAELYFGQIAEHVHVGGRRVEQDRLLDRLKLCPSRADAVLCRFDLGGNAPTW